MHFIYKKRGPFPGNLSTLDGEKENTEVRKDPHSRKRIRPRAIAGISSLTTRPEANSGTEYPEVQPVFSQL